MKIPRAGHSLGTARALLFKIRGDDMSKRVSEGGKRKSKESYVAVAEGEDNGVPFRTYYKRMWAAEQDAQRTCGEVISLQDGSHRRWVRDDEESEGGYWVDVLNNNRRL